MRIRPGLLVFIAVFQTVLFLTHFFLYETWTFSPGESDAAGPLWLKLIVGVLSVSFLAASLLAFRYTSATLRVFYRGAAVWLGLLDLSVPRGGLFVDGFRHCAIGGVGCTFPPNRGSFVQCGSPCRTVRSLQRELDAHHANYRPLGKSARGLARANSRADQ